MAPLDFDSLQNKENLPPSSSSSSAAAPTRRGALGLSLGKKSGGKRGRMMHRRRRVPLRDITHLFHNQLPSPPTGVAAASPHLVESLRRAVRDGNPTERRVLVVIPGAVTAAPRRVLALCKEFR